MSEFRQFLRVSFDTYLLNVLFFINHRFVRSNTQQYRVTDDVCTYANLVTMIGICASIAKVYVVYIQCILYFIPSIQLIVCISDILDGYIADAYNQHSRFGKVLDYSRDRIDLLSSTLVVWLLYGTKSLPYIFPILIFEGIIFISGNIFRLRKGYSGGSHCAGKMRMAVYQVCSFCILAEVYWFDSVAFQKVSFPLSLMVLASQLIFLKYVAVFCKKRYI